ncbi:hypothetical protein L5B97_11150 [Avibacterium sp. 20-15]|uniref:hypothetical protein n=1 Tax=unclassified Avibacterium TaxID=2685287 RepID=UPI0020261336|nr:MULTISPECIES: hypothetical protein [unclassified Avibacterium]URL01393.1 hypothetical protein L4F91_07555 [Avibacterium sp. 20-126]MCW9733978.1 hypothetical protein [Avibacterium sp. 20-15]MCW9734011.1 hypothetical protein [Avibacterium sp. 20-15]URL03658.1 hypothetical protein L4F93_08805 [Avibacterium sp. 20-132]URL03870.1 hypothetical protein L4F93_09955 [Avibacterium sp. 20-132]
MNEKQELIKYLFEFTEFSNYLRKFLKQRERKIIQNINILIYIFSGLLMCSLFFSLYCAFTEEAFINLLFCFLCMTLELYCRDKVIEFTFKFRNEIKTATITTAPNFGLLMHNSTYFNRCISKLLQKKSDNKVLVTVLLDTLDNIEYMLRKQ